MVCFGSFFFLFLQAPSVSHMVLVFLFVFLPSYLRHLLPTPIIDLRVALLFFLGFFIIYF